MPQYTRILSLDGGGIRGLLAVLVLIHIEEQTGQRIADLFDLIAGTSTGGVMALGLVYPGTPERPRYSAQELSNFYVEEGPKIFQGYFGLLRQFAAEKYPEEGIERSAKDYFGEVLLAEATRPVIIPTYDVGATRPHFFKSRREATDGQVPMWQIARAATAAPTFFTPIQIHMSDRTRTLIDGGMIANNPGMCALAEIRHHIEDDAVFKDMERPVLVVSLGAGQLSNNLTYDEVKNWGALDWARPTLEITINGAVEAVHYQLREILHGRGERRYYRFQPAIPDELRAIDDASPELLDLMRQIAAEMIEQHRADLIELMEKLTR